MSEQGSDLGHSLGNITGLALNKFHPNYKEKAPLKTVMSDDFSR